MTGRVVRRRGKPRRGRLWCLLGAGLVDSFCLSLAWTVVVLELTRQYGLGAASVAGTAMLIGVALSAPIATWMAQRLHGRHVLRTAGGIEAVLRAAVLIFLAADAPVMLLAVCVTAMNAMAWTGYAGMRAEVAAVSQGAGGITWYGTVVAAVEAIGVAAGALVPLSAAGGPSAIVLTLVTILYVGALVPTLVVAGGSLVPRAPRPSWASLDRPRANRATVQGALLMAVASAPTLLAVALAAEYHGRSAVGLSAAAFMLGSLFAPAVAGRLERARSNNAVSWLMLAAGMLLGWSLAPQAVAWLCIAQFLSGLCMTTLEGLLDTSASQGRPDAVTAALARATAARALGSSAGTAALPLVVATAGLTGTAVVTAAVLAALAGMTSLRCAAHSARAPAVTAAPAATTTQPTTVSATAA